jgi:hypothetical protein
MLSLNHKWNIFLLGEKNPSSIRFPRDLHHEYLESERQWSVDGAGTIKWRQHVITTSTTSTEVNGKAMGVVANGAPANFILSADGTLDEGFVRTFE